MIIDIEKLKQLARTKMNINAGTSAGAVYIKVWISSSDKGSVELAVEGPGDRVYTLRGSSNDPDHDAFGEVPDTADGFNTELVKLLEQHAIAAAPVDLLPASD